MTLARGEYAIHGTNQPSSIVFNEDIEDLYGRVSVGTSGVAEQVKLPVVLRLRRALSRVIWIATLRGSWPGGPLLCSKVGMPQVKAESFAGSARH
jgi:hypothetical protein